MYEMMLCQQMFGATGRVHDRVYNRWTGIWNGTMEWKMEWNSEHTQLQVTRAA